MVMIRKKIVDRDFIEIQINRQIMYKKKKFYSSPFVCLTVYSVYTNNYNVKCFLRHGYGKPRKVRTL